jgi:hypothetical protein
MGPHLITDAKIINFSSSKRTFDCWTSEQDESLLNPVSEEGLNITKLSKKFPDKNPTLFAQRYLKLKRSKREAATDLGKT